MAKDLLTQWNDAVWNAKRPLFVLPPHVDTDMFAGACALGHALHNAGKIVTILCPRVMSSHAQFLVHNLSVIQTLEEAKTYHCTIPSDVQIEEITHEFFHTGGGTVTVHTAPHQKMPETITFSPALPDFDRIITLGAQDLGEVAPLFGELHALLLNVPITTFAWQPSAEAFGRWNIVPEQATTLCEAIIYFLQETAPESIKDHIATCALAGIIAKTKHFRSELVTPHMLNLAADLVKGGADRMKILEELYRNRSVDALKLWGAACARLQEISPGILFSELSQDDFVRTHSSPEALQDIAQEVLQSNGHMQKVLFFYPERETLCASVVAKRPHDARDFIGALRAEGTREAAHHVFTQGTTVQDVLLIMKQEKKHS